MVRVLILIILLFLSGIASADPLLYKVEDIPLPGENNRFDYQNLNPLNGLLYISHMDNDELIVFDTKTKKASAFRGFPGATGVLCVPERERLFVSCSRDREIAVLDLKTMKFIAHIAGGLSPDGIAFAPQAGRVFVSDEAGEAVTVMDVITGQMVDKISMGGEVGNVQYDSYSRLIMANVQTTGELVAIDPQTDEIKGRYQLPGAHGNHGLLIDSLPRIAFVACEGNNRLLAVDLKSHQIYQDFATGQSPDVLAFDPTLGLLYVASESGTATLFKLHGRKLSKLGNFDLPPHAHTVSVDPDTHKAYFPLEDMDGHPVLRVMLPAQAVNQPSHALGAPVKIPTH